MIVASVVMMYSPTDGYDTMILLLTLWFVVKGIGDLAYYFTMSRFMVSGRMNLYRGLLMLDFGIFTSAMTDIPHYYVLIYLISLHAFSGLVEVLRALEAKRGGAPSWRLKCSHGVLNLLVAVCCIFYIRHMSFVVFVYCLGLIYSSILRIISACRKNRFAQIQ